MKAFSLGTQFARERDGGYNNITNTNKVSPTQNTPALQANDDVDDNDDDDDDGNHGDNDGDDDHDDYGGDDDVP